MRNLVIAILCCWVSACGGGSSSPPTTPTPPSPPPPTTASLTGRVTETVGTTSFAVEGAALSVVDGPNAGRTTTTNANGDYQLTGLQRGGFTVNVSANGYNTNGFGIDLTGDLTRNFTLTPSGPRTRFGSGQFRVNVDIAAGRYFSDPPQSGCYWERQRGFSGTLGDIIANDFIGYNPVQYIVDILGSDLAFEGDPECGTWFRDSPRHGAQSSIPPGVWLVGAQIAPGTYQISSGPGCYWERLRHFQHQGVSGVIANDFSSNARTQFVTISGSDAGFNNDGDCGTWTRTSSTAHVANARQASVEIERHRQRYEDKIRYRR